MKVAPLSVVTLEYTVTDEHGEVIDTTVGKEPLVYMHGTRYLVSGLEAALEGRAVGDAFEVTLSPEQAYGEYDEGLVQEVPGELFDGMDVAEGDTFVAETDDGHRPVTVVEVSEAFVKVDGNHPLAGVTLGFKVEIKDVRPATAEELAHGHVHGEGGCGGHHHHDHDHDHGGCCGGGHHHHDDEEQGHGGCCGGGGCGGKGHHH
ncbi:peptidylprolyl isomerase [Aeromonas schubertii]|uniref:peptidylprolyl isomerase n=1 Tax=Aeromonas schubertii TaxID=652 RepID=UPI0038B68831